MSKSETNSNSELLNVMNSLTLAIYRPENVHQLGGLLNQSVALSTILVSKVKQAQEETAFLRFFTTDLDPHNEILFTKSLVGLNVIRTY